MKFLAVVLLYFLQSAFASADLKGVVTTRRCGGVATPIQLRISDCDGRCVFIAGALYECEEDFMPSAATPSLSLRVDVCVSGFCYNILETVLPNSSVQPGFVYTVKYGIVPNDILKGNAVEIKAFIFQTGNESIETCLEFDADIR